MIKPHSNRKNLPGKSNKNKILIFKAIGILFPFFILFLFEVGLRIFNYGNNLDLFIESPQNKDYLVLNPDASKRYFTNQKIATTGNSELFRKEKDRNTLRIFVLGESTTIGYPYFHNGSFHRWLQYRLMRTFPDKDFEIINLSLTAVNSYTVLGFAKDVVKYEPDAVFIYTGHNEYYGALGVGSTENIGNNPYMVKLVLNLRELRLTQLITNVYENVVSSLAKNKAITGGSRMRLMVADQQIPYQSPRYKRGVDQFRSNMDQTLNILSKHHIPVFVSNLVSNEKDMKPFISFKVDEVKFPGFKKNYDLGLKAFKDKNIDAAYNFFRAADQIYNSHTLCNYYLGQLAFARKGFAGAKTYFSRARDLDGLRFRASGELNSIISQLCKEYPGVHFVDTKSAFEAYSDNGIIGDELILEHVHPNLRGYALMSDVFYRSIKKEKLISVTKEEEIDFKQLLHDMPVTKIDSLAGVYKITNLKKSWPFNEALQAQSFKVQSVEEKLAYDMTFRGINWPEATDNIYNYYINNHDLPNALIVLETLVLEYPTEVQFYEKAAMVSGELKDYRRALFYFKKSFSLAPSFDKARYLFVIYLQLDRPNDAIPYLDYAISNNTSNFNLLPVKAYAEKVIQLKKEYIKDSTQVSVLNQIADTYMKMDNREGAIKYLNQVLKRDRGNKDALSLLAHIRK